MALLQFDCKKGGGKTDVVQSAGSAISGAVRVTVDPTVATFKAQALKALSAVQQAIIQAPWTQSTPYLFRKTNTVPRLYARGGTGVAANAVQWVNGQAATSGFVTSHVCLTAAAPFTAIRLVFGNVDAVSYPISDASVAAGATLNDLTNSTDGARQNFVRVTFGGGSTGATVPAAVGGVASYLISDRIPVASMTRQAGDATTWSKAGGKLSDCFVLPLVHVRVAQPITSASTPLLGQSSYGGNASTTDAPYTPAQPTITGQMTAVTHKVDTTAQTSVGAAAALTGTSSGTLSGILSMPITGIIFEYASNAMSVATMGDSITRGAGILHDGSADANSPANGSSRSWARVAPETVSTMAQPIEFCHLALDGQSTTTFEGYFEAIIAAGIIPTHAVYASFSPNDGPNGPGATQVTNLNAFLTRCAANNVYPITWTSIPVGLLAAQKQSNAGELARLAWNASMRAGTLVNNAYGQPIDYIEMELAGDGSGQIMSDLVTPIASMTNAPVHWGDAATTQNLHPNYTGDKVMRAQLANKVSSIAARYFAA